MKLLLTKSLLQTNTNEDGRANSQWLFEPASAERMPNKKQ